MVTEVPTDLKWLRIMERAKARLVETATRDLNSGTLFEIHN